MKVVNSNHNKCVFKNFDSLVGSIKRHIAKNSNVLIIQDDRPQKLQLGYRDLNSDTVWYIRIRYLRDWMKKQDENKKNILQRAFLTQEGKEKLIKSFYK